MDSAYVCKPCDKIFTGIHPYNDHLESQKHKKKVNSAPNLVMDSSKHVPSSGEIKIDQYIKKLGKEYKCIACNVYMNNIVTAESHAKGLKHLKTISKHVIPLDNDIATNSKSALTPPNSEYISIFDGTFHMHSLSIEEVMKDVKVVNANERIIF